MTTRDVGAIIDELRAHPDCLALVVWLPADTEGLADPDAVQWGDVEDRMTERGWDSIYYFTDPKAMDA